MPVSVIVGGQFGSEGKGKVALHVAVERQAGAVVRVGGPNSGHTACDRFGKPWVLRQLPAASLKGDCLVVIPAGSLVDSELLLGEVAELGLTPDRLLVDARASVVTAEHKRTESAADLRGKIGSTASGTGAALVDRIGRTGPGVLAQDIDGLRPFVRPFVAGVLRRMLDRGERIVIEGTQGFGLSLWHSPHYPYATSRDTTCAGFVSEAGLSCRDVDDITLVVRALPIRVGGNSGPLPNELGWREVCREAGLPEGFKELTSATQRPRRIARFDPEIVKQAIAVNNPDRVVLNHLDYVDPAARIGHPTEKSRQFVECFVASTGRRVDFVGYGPARLDPWISSPKLSMVG